MALDTAPDRQAPSTTSSNRRAQAEDIARDGILVLARLDD